MPERPLIVSRTQNMTDGPIYKQDHQSYMDVMSNPKLFSRAEVSALSSVPDDALVFWIRNGLLKSEERGQRQHHRFTMDEVKIAAILGEARSIGLNIGTLSEISDQLRHAIKYYRNFPQFPHLIDAIGYIYPSDMEQGYKEMVETGWFDENQMDIIRSWGEVDDEIFWIGFQIIENDGNLIAIKNDIGGWTLKKDTDNLYKFEGRSAILFNLDKILGHLNMQDSPE